MVWHEVMSYAHQGLEIRPLFGLQPLAPPAPVAQKGPAGFEILSPQRPGPDAARAGGYRRHRGSIPLDGAAPRRRAPETRRGRPARRRRHELRARERWPPLARRGLRAHAGRRPPDRVVVRRKGARLRHGARRHVPRTMDRLAQGGSRRRRPYSLAAFARRGDVRWRRARAWHFSRPAIRMEAPAHRLPLRAARHLPAIPCLDADGLPCRRRLAASPSGRTGFTSAEALVEDGRSPSRCRRSRRPETGCLWGR